MKDDITYVGDKLLSTHALFFCHQYLVVVDFVPRTIQEPKNGHNIEMHNDLYIDIIVNFK